MDGFVTSIPVDDWKTLLRWRLLNTRRPLLPKRFADERLRLQQAVHRPEGACAALEEVHQATPACSAKRSDRSMSTAHVQPAAKARAKAIVDNMVVGARRTDPAARLDERPTKTAGARQARRVHAQDRLPRQVARLLEARGEARPVSRQLSAARASGRRRRNWAKVGKPVDKYRVGHDAADGERVLQPELERDRLPGRHSAAAVLRSRTPTTP